MARVAREEQFVNARRQWCAGGIDTGGFCADDHGHLHAPVLARGIAEMRRPTLVNLPVHAHRLFVIDLDAIHADVALACERIFAVAHSQSNKASAIVRPALEDGEHIDVEVLGENDFLAGSMGYRPGADTGKFRQFRQEFDLVHQSFGRSILHKVNPFFEALAQFIEVVYPEGPRHAFFAAEYVDENGYIVAGYVLEEQGWTTCLAHAVGNLGNFQLAFDGSLDALQVSFFFEEGGKVAQILKCHVKSVLCLVVLSDILYG